MPMWKWWAILGVALVIGGAYFLLKNAEKPTPPSIETVIHNKYHIPTPDYYSDPNGCQKC